jgi:hypothetical protein
MKPAPKDDDDEWRKTLTAIISLLALTVTGEIWTDRILGRTQDAHASTAD